jgi:CMP-N-acetylneuraminic acid synthetase
MVQLGEEVIMPSIVALIPARSGSKRVADKNVRRLGGHPLMAYTIAAAHAAGIFDSIVVSTDSESYAAVARHYGAEVPFLRPPAFAGATSPDIEWLAHLLTELKARGKSYDCFSILRPTNPFRTAGTIRRAWQAFQAEKGVDSLRAVEKVTQHPGKMWVIRGRRMFPLMPLTPADRPWHSMQMAALPEVHVQNASLEIAWSHVALEEGSIAGSTLLPFLTTDVEGFDINNPYDWAIAEAMLADGSAKLPHVDTPPFPN